MTSVQFIEVKPFTSCCKDLEVLYHIPSSIPASSKHYIALCEVGESSQFTWVWAGKTALLQEEGITVKWRKGKVTFTSQVLPKLSDGREYYLMYCNEDGTILGESRPFQFFTESDEFSSIDLQSAPSEDAVVISMHHKKELDQTTCPEVILPRNNNYDTTSFEVLSEHRYSDTSEPLAGDKEQDLECFSQSVRSTVIPRIGDKVITVSSATNLDSDTKSDDEVLTSSYNGKGYQNLPMESNNNQEVIQKLISELLAVKIEIKRLTDEVNAKENIIEAMQTENAALKEQMTLNALTNSTVVINSSKDDDREKRILKKRIQEEAKKSARFEELLDHKEALVLQLENEKAELIAKLKKLEEQLQMVSQKVDSQQIHNSQTSTLQPKKDSTVKENGNSKLAEDEIVNYNKQVGGEFKTKLFLKLFRRDVFVCHKCNEVLPAHTQEFTRLNHVEHCKGLL